MKVLLVDDEHELVSTLAERLSLRGIEADWAISGEEAIRLAEKKSYDVAVLDVKIPGISGLELKRKLQSKRPDLKFIFMTGHGSEEDFRTCSAETADGCYLVKPANIEDLIQKMSELMKRSEVRP
ncbi:MAG: response regulator receiver protein [Deltaproteobacteria bacterium]|jgi:DNA-binding response OmpR family regulator|nr:response regulator receiver protein [Deltaproteobacteria bacterium]